jgi:hypothetical protein
MEFPAKTPDELASDLSRADKVTLKFDNENHTLTPEEVGWFVTGLMERDSWKAQFESAAAAASEYSEFWEKHQGEFDIAGNYIAAYDGRNCQDQRQQEAEAD